MSLITHIGGKESDSFVSLAEADAIMPTLPDETDAWDDLEDAQKELRLRMAAAMMYVIPWKGRRAYCGQALCFPRSFQGNPHSIPQSIKEVQCFLSYSVVHRALANRPESVTEAITGARVTRVSLGGLLSVSFSGTSIEAGSGVEKIVRTAAFPAYLTCLNYIAQVRGGSIQEAEERSCSTTTTTSSTTSTSSSTTSTTV